ncbi:hypothetical protein ACQKQC_18970 [Vibrio fortis]|uniref:hypothetical protein n=1 Tax=Vibrio fortis TaxID=212667 RepID=UPI004067B754
MRLSKTYLASLVALVTMTGCTSEGIAEAIKPIIDEITKPDKSELSAFNLKTVSAPDAEDKTTGRDLVFSWGSASDTVTGVKYYVCVEDKKLPDDCLSLGTVTDKTEGTFALDRIRSPEHTSFFVMAKKDGESQKSSSFQYTYELLKDQAIVSNSGSDLSTLLQNSDPRNTNPSPTNPETKALKLETDGTLVNKISLQSLVKDSEGEGSTYQDIGTIDAGLLPASFKGGKQISLSKGDNDVVVKTHKAEGFYSIRTYVKEIWGFRNGNIATFLSNGGALEYIDVPNIEYISGIDGHVIARNEAECSVDVYKLSGTTASKITSVGDCDDRASLMHTDEETGNVIIKQGSDLSLYLVSSDSFQKVDVLGNQMPLSELQMPTKEYYWTFSTLNPHLVSWYKMSIDEGFTLLGQHDLKGVDPTQGPFKDDMLRAVPIWDEERSIVYVVADLFSSKLVGDSGASGAQIKRLGVLAYELKGDHRSGSMASSFDLYIDNTKPISYYNVHLSDDRSKIVFNTEMNHFMALGFKNGGGFSLMVDLDKDGFPEGEIERIYAGSVPLEDKPTEMPSYSYVSSDLMSYTLYDDSKYFVIGDEASLTDKTIYGYKYRP